MTPEEFFDTIYTMHLNDFVRMPKTELYELMEAYAEHNNKALQKQVEELEETEYGQQKIIEYQENRIEELEQALNIIK